MQGQQWHRRQYCRQGLGQVKLQKQGLYRVRSTESTRIVAGSDVGSETLAQTRLLG